tara:strand:- start:160 stop:360 length:201 start_codon:yes stop_codon:yes gene_type:complete
MKPGEQVEYTRRGVVVGVEPSALKTYKRGQVEMVVVQFEDGTVDRFGPSRQRALKGQHKRKMPVIG